MGGSSFDAVVIGSGLGGLTAGALLAKQGYSVCLLERNHSLGGAASVYKIGSLLIEASLHETANPCDPRDPKHHILARLGLLDAIPWVPVEKLYTVQGGPLDEPFTLPHGFENAQSALAQRFPAAKQPLADVVGKIQGISGTIAELSDARERRSLSGLFGLLSQCYPIVSGWKLSLDDVFAAAFGENEGLKFALAANLPYFAADPARLWWLFYAVAQGGYIGAGGVFVKGGSRALSLKLASAIKRAGGTVFLGTAASAVELNAAGEVAAVHIGERGGKPAQRIPARIVLANCAPDAIVRMLPSPACQRFHAAYDEVPLSTSLFSAHFGLKANPSQFGLSAYSTILLPDWMRRLADYKDAAAVLQTNPAGRLPPLIVVNYGAIDADLDPQGPLLITAAGLDTISNWRGLSHADEIARRNAWLDAILGELERHYPGFAGAVTEKIFISAAAMERYLGTPDGAIYGFDPLPPTKPIWAGLPRSPRTPIPGLFLASSFGGSGGYSGAMASGADAAHLVAAKLRAAKAAP